MNETRKAKDYTVAILVDKTPKQVYHAVRNVRGWWSGEITGRTDELGAEWTYRYQDLHRSTQKVTEMVPGKKVVGHVTDSYLSFVKDKTELRFTHVGLTPAIECYSDGSDAWRFHIRDSLPKLITAGKGAPNPPE